MYLELGDPGAAGGAHSPDYLGPESRTLHAAFNLKLAKTLPDQLGLHKRDASRVHLHPDRQVPVALRLTTVSRSCDQQQDRQ